VEIQQRSPAVNTTVTHQSDLFLETAPSSDPLIGRPVTLDTPCRTCGSTTALIESGCGPHLGELRCRNCNKHRQWISRESYVAIAEFVAEIGDRFGLTFPINFRSLNTRKGGEQQPFETNNNPEPVTGRVKFFLKPKNKATTSEPVPFNDDISDIGF
jgi:hypothetical protein